MWTVYGTNGCLLFTIYRDIWSRYSSSSSWIQDSSPWMGAYTVCAPIQEEALRTPERLGIAAGQCTLPCFKKGHIAYCLGLGIPVKNGLPGHQI